jgi:hypothetical protein
VFWVYVLGRVAVRTGVALWRHRLAVVFAGLLVAVFSVYQLTFAGPSVANGDCADTTMTAITRVDDSAAHAAYACLGATMRTTSEDQFVAELHQRAIATGKFDRVGERPTSDGGRIVFYTVEGGGGPAVGYIVYLNSRGKVIKVE